MSSANQKEFVSPLLDFIDKKKLQDFIKDELAALEHIENDKSDYCPICLNTGFVKVFYPTSEFIFSGIATKPCPFHRRDNDE